MIKKFSSLFLLCCIILSANMQQLHAQPPVINSFIPAKGYVGSLVTIKGSALNKPTLITIGGVNAIIISSSDTQVVAMVMPGATTGAVSVITAGGSATTANNFVVDLSLPPNKQLGDKLNGQSSAPSSQQGSGVAVSADGNTAVVGAGYDTGGVFVYTRSNNAWAQQGDKLVGSGAADGSLGSDQGYSVAISADGNTIIEGGVSDNGFTGAAWIFVRDKNGIWSQQGNKLVGSNSIIIGSTTPEQGYSVNISADGNTVIVGGRRDSNYIGAAWIFIRSNNVWMQQQKLIGAGHVSIAYHQGFPTYLGVDMGTSVAMSADGNTAFIGGPVDNNDTGAVWVFIRNGNTWTQQGNKLVGTGGNRSFLGGIQQGTSVAASADGNTLIVGAPFDLDSTTTNNTDNYYNGAAWIFKRNGSTWSQQGNKIFATDASLSAEQGWSVSISADGNTAIVGAPGDSTYVGGSWLYTRSNNVWAQSSNKLLGTGYFGGPKQGFSVNISADGNTAIIGGPQDNPLGAAWVFADSTNILPLTIIDFTAAYQGKIVRLDWKTTQEINSSYFDIERSIDALNFSRIGSVAANGNNNIVTDYSFNDNALPYTIAQQQTLNYRLKMVDKDGQFAYSKVVVVNFNASSLIKIYPIPAKNFLQITGLNSSVPATISIINISGNIVKKITLQNTNYLCDVSRLTPGTYYISIVEDKKITNLKFVKE